MDNLNQEFNVGDVIETTIMNFANYGVFTDCGQGYKGLIHVSNIANEFVKNVQDYFSVNQVIKAEIVNIDHKNKKIGLSTKQFNIQSKKSSFSKSYSNNKKF